MLEAVYARGDRRLSAALVNAYNAGCRFDSWKELFDFDKWLCALEQAGIDPAFYASRERGKDETLPWDMIDSGISKAYLWDENVQAQAEATTPDCRAGCTGCGLKEAGMCV